MKVRLLLAFTSAWLILNTHKVLTPIKLHRMSLSLKALYAITLGGAPMTHMSEHLQHTC